MKNDYLVTSHPLASLTRFTLPIMAGAIIQQFYNIVDTAIVGNYVGQNAVAAVGACLALTNVFIFISTGAGIGSGVIVGNYYGAKDYNKMKVVILTSFVSFIGLSFFLALIGLVCGPLFLKALNTPLEALDMSCVYLSIYFYGLPFVFLYNILSNLFNAFGKSKYPLVFLIISSLLNVVLDFIFVGYFHMGVMGASWATLIAQGFSSILSLLFFIRLIRGFNIGKTLLFSKFELIKIIKIALPSMFQQCTISIGLLLIQACINQFGSEALAGYSVGLKIEGIGSLMMVSSGTALSTYVSQNLGAGKSERIPLGLKASNIIVVISCFLFFIIIYPLSPYIIKIFLQNKITPMAYDTALRFIHYMCIVLVIMGIKQNGDGLLRGSKCMLPFTLGNVLNITLRVVFSYSMAPYLGVDAVWISNPIGWFSSLLVSYIAYRRLYKATR